MTTTQNKGYAIITTGTEAGTWGDTLNSDVFEIIDNNLGGIVVKGLTSSNVTLSATESQMAIVRLTGALLANVQVTTSCIGSFFVENLTTGNFSVTVTNGVSGVVVPQLRATLIADQTNGVRIASQAGFPSGTKQPFFNSTAPPGYTKDTSLNNGTIRMVSGNVGSDGGASDFTSVFASRTILQANLPNYSLTVNDPGHSHTITAFFATSTGGGNPPGYITGPRQGSRSDLTSASTSTTGITVSSGGSGTALDFNVKYCDAIRAAVT